MDTKALARSKRAHSLHHSKKHKPHQVSRTPSNVSGSKNPTGNQSREKPSESQGSRLPLNRESYVDDLDLGLEEAGPTEFVVPKSKGGDYAQLISDAKAQSPANYSSDFVPFFDDVIYGMFIAFDLILRELNLNLVKFRCLCMSPTSNMIWVTAGIDCIELYIP